MSSSNKHFIWIKLDANFFGLYNNIYVCNVYLPPSNSTYLKTNDADIFDMLREDLIQYSNKGQLMLIGDLNSRLGNAQEKFSFINNDFEQENEIIKRY